MEFIIATDNADYPDNGGDVSSSTLTQGDTHSTSPPDDVPPIASESSKYFFMQCGWCIVVILSISLTLSCSGLEITTPLGGVKVPPMLLNSVNRWCGDHPYLTYGIFAVATAGIVYALYKRISQ